MAEKLAAYRGKRDFGKTAEPRGSRRKRAREGGIFAVQYHAATGLHYDLRLEWGGVLLSWAVPKGPSLDPRDKRLAVKVEDHPIEYAAFEGTIPKGQYGGGTVMLWDEGTFRPDNDFAAGLKSGSLKFTLYGRRLQGKWALVRIKDDADERQDNWLLIKESDEYARDDAGIASYKTGVRSGRTFDEIASGADPKPRKNPIKRVTPQLAKLADEIPVGEDWLFEIKYDGYRILSYSENGGTQLLTRNGIDFTDKFAEIADSKGEIISKVNRLVACNKEIAENKANILKLENQIESLRPWLALDVPMKFKGTDKVAMLLGTMPGETTLESVYELVRKRRLKRL